MDLKIQSLKICDDGLHEQKQKRKWSGQDRKKERLGYENKNAKEKDFPFVVESLCL